MKPDQRALDAVVAKMLSPKDFFTEYWGRRPVHVAGAGLECVGHYGVDDYLEDLAATQPTPYVVSGVQDGERVYSRHATLEELRLAVEAGGVVSMKLNRNWHEPNMPESWVWMRALYGRLCRAASMIYLSPRRSEDVDLFLAGPKSQFGAHYDLTHVFTLQLGGERKWVVEDAVSLEEARAAARNLTFRQGKELAFVGPTHEVILRPGDAFYVPARCVHGVTGVSWSLSLSLGLRAFNEVDVVGHLLGNIERTKYLEYPPVDSLPESLGERHVEAKMQLLKRVRTLLKQLEMAARGSVLAPLRLPTTLSSKEPGGGTNLG
jgi:ribosomal protein L16 Arg81 hydroxylase